MHYDRVARYLNDVFKLCNYSNGFCMFDAFSNFVGLKKNGLELICVVCQCT